MKCVCEVYYSSHCILVELQALLLVCWFKLELRNERTAYYSRVELELERGYLWVCLTLTDIHTPIHTWVNCVSS